MSYVEITITLTAIASIGNLALQMTWYLESRNKDG